jgi:hypothetical protein
MKSENLNFLETSGPLQACNRTVLPFYVCGVNTIYRIYAGVKYCLLISIDFDFPRSTGI